MPQLPSLQSRRSRGAADVQVTRLPRASCTVNLAELPKQAARRDSERYASSSKNMRDEYSLNVGIRVEDWCYAVTWSDWNGNHPDGTAHRAGQLECDPCDD